MTPTRSIASAATLLLLVLLAGRASADPYADVRSEFRSAYAQAGRAPAIPVEDSDALRAYPLYPYLQAERLKARLDDPSAAAEIDEFLEAYGDQPVARSLRRSWLMTLSQRKAWAPYLASYREDVDDTAAARCNALAARVALGRTDDLAQAVTSTYLSPKSLPDACDPAFDWLRAQGGLTPEIIERRARMALAEGEAGLARYLARSLPDARAAPVNQWAALIERPRAEVEALIAAPSRPVEPAALLDGWTRYARSDPDAAADRYATLVEARRLDAADASRFALAVALPLSWRRDDRSLEYFARVREVDFDERGHEWHARASLWAGDWPRVAKVVAAMPESLRSQNRWRYWAARAAEQVGDDETARSGYAEVIPTDNWYAALSAARLEQRFTPTVEPVPRDDAVMDGLRQQPAFVRTRELILCDLDSDANREWLAALEPLTPAERAQAVRLASGWGWHLQAIAAAAREGIFDDYDLLYPRPYDAEVRSAAASTGLPGTLIYAIIRQESLYRADAASSAGALGLMQLLPSTARITARRNGQRNPSRSELLIPSVNVPLGSAFLRSLLDRAAGQLPLAIAGYNAGPAAARRWLDDVPVETDVWVENIPYNETRTYVQRVAWHALVFAWLEDREPQNVSRWLGTVRPPPVAASLQPAD